VRQTQGLEPVPWDDHREEVETAVSAEEAVPGGVGEVGEVGAPGVAVELPEGWTIAKDGGCARLAVVGPLDLVSAPALRDALIELFGDNARVAVDLSGCDFLDSVGLGVLLAAIARAQEQGAAVTFKLSEAADRVLSISGVLERLELEA
jgi:anti-sigma B factor antagonist